MSDIEIEAMSTIAAALSSLEGDAQERVVRWAAARYGVSVSGGRREGGSPDSAVDTGGGSQDGAVGNRTPAYEHFGELFAATSPESNEDKSLVAAYWVQVHEEQSQWQSRRVNSALKDLGHAIPNITDALTKNMQKKPQRVIQLKKSGGSKQATKTYKVTDAGIRHVRDMIGQGGT